jgi:hypothetical protein
MESAAIAGIVYGLLAGAAWLVVLDYPDPALSDAELEAWFDDGGNQFWLLAGLNLASVSAVAFLWFVAVIRRRVGEREDKFFGTVFFGSAIIHTVFWIVGVAALAAIPAAKEFYGSDASADAGTVAAFGGFGAALLFVAGPRIQALFVLSTSTLFIRTNSAPKWLGIAGYALGVGLFVMPLIIEPVGLAFPAWVFVVSVTILLTRRSP